MTVSLVRETTDIIAEWLVRALVAAIEFAPQKLAHAIARGIVAVAILVMPRLRRAGRRNLELVFGQVSEEVLFRSEEVLARNLVAFAKMPRLDARTLLERYEFAEARKLWEERLIARSKGKGILLITMHYGSFEMLAQAYIVGFRPMCILARGFGLRRLDRFWRRRREVFGGEVFDRKGGYQAMVRRLNEGRDVAVLCDQNVKANHAIFVDFFGIPAATTKAVALAALRTGAPAVVAVSYEYSPNRYKILAEEIPDPGAVDGSTEERIRQFMTWVHAAMEKFIRAHPEQWFWIHRRFKTRPPGEAEDLYRD